MKIQIAIIMVITGVMMNHFILLVVPGIGPPAQIVASILVKCVGPQVHTHTEQEGDVTVGKDIVSGIELEVERDKEVVKEHFPGMALLIGRFISISFRKTRTS